jgi:hypothetical protein
MDEASAIAVTRTESVTARSLRIGADDDGQEIRQTKASGGNSRQLRGSMAFVSGGC